MSQQDALVVAGIRVCEEERAEAEAAGRRKDEVEIARLYQAAQQKGGRHGP